MSSQRYHVLHDTIYRYDQPVGESRQLIRLSPRTLPWQKVLAHRLEIQPEPTRSADFLDGFGNPVRAIHLEADHEALLIRAESWIELAPRALPELARTPSWESVRDTLAYRAGRRYPPEVLEATAFRFESTHVRVKREFAHYAHQAFGTGRPVLDGVRALMGRIFEEFTFDPEATDVSTPVTDVFATKRGVCQDFSHFMISCLRSLGLAARYTSGYLLTRPPPGKPRLVGADATHAWVSVFCPGLGWVDFDPTNDLLPGLEHITLGWGRDFADVSPLRGVILGGGSHEPAIAVTVVPESEFDQVYEGEAVPELDLAPQER
ncbi:MAG: transglutaminase family protein [Rhodocyclaceae bacterium]|jgi:transglutaminase-like putative cysteine protease|nr:transglutaminase family protein [Rhodocyclaceae bacterium]